MLPTDLMEKVEKNLSHKRYLHSLGVAYTAASLAMAHKLDADQAFLAGLLHDCAKELSVDKTLKYCKEHNIVLSEEYKSCFGVVHGLTGSFMAREKYKICDEQVLSAIRYHVSGKPDMTSLEEMIFIADYIEPSRKFSSEEFDLMRKAAFSNLRLGVYLVSESICSYLLNSGNKVVSEIVETRDFYKEYCRNAGLI